MYLDACANTAAQTNKGKLAKLTDGVMIKAKIKAVM